MSKKNSSFSCHPSFRSRGRPKNHNGVQAILERLTQRTPCPDYLLKRAYKYLRSDLFAEFSPRGKTTSNENKLASDSARNLLMNALELDDLFLGDVSDVIKVLKKQHAEKDLEAMFDTANREASRRFERYAYWHRRGTALKAVMADPSLDFKSERLDARLNQYLPQSSEQRIGSFAMRAMQQVERIEEQGRLADKDANVLAELAEAYLDLGDAEEAAVKAQEAVDLDPQNAKGWFVRVVAAIRLRDTEVRQMQQWNLEATEMADPMSAHESMAHDMASEASGRAHQRQATMVDIAAQALLHWPTTKWGHPSHAHWQAIVKKVFLSHCFLSIRLDGRMTDSMSTYALNGFGPEWNLTRHRQEIRRFEANAAHPELPFSTLQITTLLRLLNEPSLDLSLVNPVFVDDYLAWELKLLHLRWVMKAPGYDQQWADFAATVEHVSPDTFEQQILNRPHLAMLFQSHMALNGGAKAVMNAMHQWQQRATAQRAQENRRRLLGSYVMLYHHQFARSDFAGCQSTCEQAIEQIGSEERPEALMDHPFEADIRLPAYSKLHWHYLYALATVKLAYAGVDQSEGAQAFISQASQWREAFKDHRACFWRLEEVFEGGGGTDDLVPPYDLNLTEESGWRDPTRTDSSKPFTDFVLLTGDVTPTNHDGHRSTQA